MKLKSKYLLFLVVPLVIIAIYPVRILVIPRMTLKVIDVNGNSVPNTVVEQSWQHYSFESASQYEKVQADERGFVTFSEKSIRAPFLLVLLDPVFEIININPHAGTGPHAFFLVDEYDSNLVRYKPSEPIPAQIILKRKFER